jgi:AraC family transcriptional regulator
MGRMQVSLVTFPETKVAFIRHRGHPAYRTYGLHYTDPRNVDPAEHQVDFCLSFDGPVEPNPHGIGEMTIPSMRCALARDVGSRLDNQAARYLFDVWLPQSGEQIDSRPLVFHYVNVGPGVKEHEAITDVYLPIK